MADEWDGSAARVMDLNLYLGLPLSPRHRILDLGSDLALAPAPSAAMPSAAAEPYSPSRAAEYDPYFPSYSPHVEVLDEEEEEPLDARYSPSHALIQEPDPLTSPRDGDPQAPYDPLSPPYVPLPGSPRPAYELSAAPVVDLVGGDDPPSPPSSRELAYRPELRFRRLIESSRLLGRRRFRLSLPYDANRPELDSPPSPTPVRLLHDIMSSHRSLEAGAGKSKAGAEGGAVEGEEKEDEEVEKSRNAANFECNICLDMAKEPVVTSCGHLFCWPCLYQWLHVHSEHKECPVCKGEVVEANITPIFGRGSSEDGSEKDGVEVESGVKIPPRPRGNRFESFRQQLVPFSRRLGEGIASWRRRINERMRLGGRIDRHGEPSLPGAFAPRHRGGLTRLRPQTVQREGGNPASGSSTGENQLPENNAINPQNNDTSSVFQDGIDLLHQFSFYGLAPDRLAAWTADFSGLVGRFASSNGRYEASVASSNPLNPEPQTDWRPMAAPVAGDQASASSTMAVIEGDFTVTGASADPNSAGSSRSLRRRGRSGNSASLDVDGGGLHGRKRRRLN